MTLDPSHIGRSCQLTEPYEVGREKIREFAFAIGDSNPVYHDPEAAKALGHPDVIAPPTFPIVFTFAASNPLLEQLGVELSQVVHGDQRFAYTRPIHPGDRLACAVEIENIRAMAGNSLLTMRAVVTTTEDEPVVTAWSTLVVRVSQQPVGGQRPAGTEGAV
ncbi:MAG: FAS1-like dehydratase domain-containing protein [Micromonosporaceae bacterium]